MAEGASETPEDQLQAKGCYKILEVLEAAIEQFQFDPRVNISDELKIGFFTSDHATQTDRSEILPLKELTSSTGKLVQMITSFQVDFGFIKDLLQLKFEDRLKEESLNIITNIHDRIKDIEKHYHQNEDNMRKSFQQQLTNAIAVVKGMYQRYFDVEEEKSALHDAANIKLGILKRKLKERDELIKELREQLEQFEEAGYQKYDSASTEPSSRDTDTHKADVDYKVEYERLLQVISGLEEEVQLNAKENSVLEDEILSLKEFADQDQRTIQKLIDTRDRLLAELDAEKILVQEMMVRQRDDMEIRRRYDTMMSKTTVAVAPSRTDMSAVYATATPPPTPGKRKSAKRVEIQEPLPEQVQREPPRYEPPRPGPPAKPALREPALRGEPPRREPPLWEQSSRDQVLRELPVREQSSRELPVREQSSRELPVRELSSRDLVLREQSSREQVLREQALREQTQREQAKREQAQREQAQREQAPREQAPREERKRVEVKEEDTKMWDVQMDALKMNLDNEKRKLERYRKEADRINRNWERKFYILRNSFHVLKDEMFTRHTLFRQFALLADTSFNYLKAKPLFVQSKLTVSDSIPPSVKEHHISLMDSKLLQVVSDPLIFSTVPRERSVSLCLVHGGGVFTLKTEPAAPVIPPPLGSAH
ncbi:uncharacterized protein C10orf67 homolog, mitochondrial [Perognathus longimembris pacificus]|uniref:uncharacterized protein C10orf67 homolog, mitochondrial n=1 Tax=Perognathus longimembris pacificus TaxID=214514 RepID=UPI002018E956|nr:uncharacterized protein C10orf67 homolog, mitochondrial [Perognathus longimembris pacificus]